MSHVPREPLPRVPCGVTIITTIEIFIFDYNYAKYASIKSIGKRRADIASCVRTIPRALPFLPKEYRQR